MKKLTLIIPFGAALALISFFLPWLKVSCVGIIGLTVSGSEAGGIFWWIPVFAGLIIALFLLAPMVENTKRIKQGILICTIAALLVFVIKYIMIASGHQNFIATLALKTIRIHLRFGVITTLLGFLLALAGLPLLKTGYRGGSPVVGTEVEMKTSSMDEEAP